MNTSTKAALVLVDWGTTNLRAYVLDEAGGIIDRLCSDKGMSSLTVADFEPTLLDLLAPYLTPGDRLPVMCSGMVGSRQGWQEAPYLTAPCKAPSGTDVTRVNVKDPRLSVWIIPGVKQTKPSDVMRGEETQIAGFLKSFPKFDGVICLPGTHTKWVRISAEEIVSFQTFMTGEMFSLLADRSVLRHSVDATELDEAAFSTAVTDAMARPQSIAAKLFNIRADALISELSMEQGRGQLSGYLIGVELAAARPYWLGMEVAIIGAPSLCELYQKALSAQGCPAEIHDAAPLTMQGLAAAYTSIKEIV